MRHPRAVAGFIPMLAATLMGSDDVAQFAEFVRRANWDAKFRPAQLQNSLQKNATDTAQLLRVLTRGQLERLLQRLFDEDEFLSPFGIRSMSRFHERHPSVYTTGGASYTVDYESGEGTSGAFGGNSNWRGPVWFPINDRIFGSVRINHFFTARACAWNFPLVPDSG